MLQSHQCSCKTFLFPCNTFPVVCYSKDVIPTCGQLCFSLPFKYFSFTFCSQFLLDSVLEQVPVHKSTAILSWDSLKKKRLGPWHLSSMTVYVKLCFGVPRQEELCFLNRALSFLCLMLCETLTVPLETEVFVSLTGCIGRGCESFKPLTPCTASPQLSSAAARLQGSRSHLKAQKHLPAPLTLWP